MSGHYDIVRPLRPYYEGGCGPRFGFEQEYSHHLEGRVSAEEWQHGVIEPLNYIVEKYSVKRGWGYLITLVCLLPLFLYIPYFTAWNDPDLLGDMIWLWVFLPGAVELLVLLVLFLIVARRRQKLWMLLSREVADINAKFAGRGINVVVRRSHHWGYYRRHSSLVLRVEIAQMGYQSVVPLPMGAQVAYPYMPGVVAPVVAPAVAPAPSTGVPYYDNSSMYQQPAGVGGNIQKQHVSDNTPLLAPEK